ncbi:class I SAM-dependent methyltransferase [Alienimonas chondri]|uniref:class I SAM-dependent methyltransferase n=1 Tax=Alienimonas chondri TaxID=2681879 RepID=UPI001488DF63|nr:class I SAM-dependent methyltransferase [Alienimonas chondri]
MRQQVVDLGTSPLCENFLTAEELNRPEPFYPLAAYVCGECYLVQVEEYVSGREIFGGEYAYFSSFSDSWLKHAADYADRMTDRLGLNADSFVLELASNDGYLLKNFVAKGVPCLGVEPAANCAAAAEERGVPTRVMYFGVEAAQELAAEGVSADLMVANNCAAHVPDLNDFFGGMRLLLRPGGVVTVEVAHWLTMLEGNQFDQIYQEHYCYFSLLTLRRVCAAHGLTLYDVDEIPTHGGSLRIYARHEADDAKPVTSAVTDLIEREKAAGLTEMATYAAFGRRVEETKRKLLEFLIDAKRAGKSIVGYGAPGKGNTLLNYCGVRTDFLDYVVDRNPYKHGKFLPGTHIPVYPTERIAETRPDLVLILPWNLKEEIAAQLTYVREWGGALAVPIPEATYI